MRDLVGICHNRPSRDSSLSVSLSPSCASGYALLASCPQYAISDGDLAPALTSPPWRLFVLFHTSKAHSAFIVPASWGAFYKKGLWMVKESARKFLVARFSGDNFWWGWEKIVILLLKSIFNNRKIGVVVAYALLTAVFKKNIST